MHGPVGSEPQESDRCYKRILVFVCYYRFVTFDSVRSDDFDCVISKQNGTEDDKPYFRVELVSPDIGACREHYLISLPWFSL